MLYQIDDLRTVIETAKRVLTKEKIDKQRTGQSSTSPFMKASQGNSKTNSEKGVSFDALETIERNSDSIDQLTSLVNRMDMKLDRRETQYRQKSIKLDTEDTVKDRTIIGPEIDPTVEIVVNIIIEEEEIIIMIGITDPTIELEIGQEMAMEIGEMMGLIIDNITEGIIIDRKMVTKGIEIEV